MSASAHAVAPPAVATAPPVQRIADPMVETQEAPQRLLTSLSSVPAVQRKCAACAGEENEDQMPVQPRLEVGPVDDPYEREADNIAGQVMAMREPAPASAAGATVQRACAACSGKSDEVQRAPAEIPELIEDDTETPRMRAMAETTSTAGGVVQRACTAYSKSEEVQRAPADFSELTKDDDQTSRMRATGDNGGEHIAASSSQLTSGGSSLAGPTRDFFESRMGRDLSDVRVHHSSDADALNQSISARAFTYKNHVWLGTGESAGPSYTMAHELAHVMQQTAPGPVGPQAQRHSDRDGAASASGAAVQRREDPFWLPGVTLNAKKLHKNMHDKAIDKIRSVDSSILSEVPIPGANRELVNVGAKGRADIYTATANPEVMVPGVKEVVAAAPTSSDAGETTPAPTTPSAVPTASIASLDNFSPTMIEPMKQGSAVVAQDQRRAPKISAGQLTDITSAPTQIRIGEMKPYHDMNYRKLGAKQIANYIAGITSVANTVNSVAKAAGQDDRWNPNAKVINVSSLIPSGWDAGKAHTDWPQLNLKIRHYKPTPAKTRSGRRKIKAADSRQGRPKSQPIRGRWMMAPDNKAGHEGVAVYFLAPNPTDLKAALGPTSTRTEFRRLSAKLEKIKRDLIASPKPVASGAKAQPRRLPARTPLPQASAAPARPARKEVKDNFKASDWEKARSGAGPKSGEKDNSLLGDYAAAADNDLREEIAEKGAMVEWLKTKPATKTTYTEKVEYDTLLGDLKLLKGVDFWTGIKAKPFGILREKFGLFFVKAYQKAASFGKRIREKFKSFKEGKILAGKKGTIIKAAAKVASVVLPRLAKPFMAKMFDTIVQCGIVGFEAKFRELIEGTFIEDVIETAEQLKGKVETLGTDVEAYFKGLINKTVEPIAKEFEQFVSEAKLVLDVANMVKEITQAIRIGSCVTGLALSLETVGIGAIVGCGAALGDYILSKFGLSPVDHLIGSILSSCDMQNKLGKLMAGIGFIKTLPKRAGRAIITEVKTLLKDSDALKGLGSFKGKDFGQHASELFCNPDSLQFPGMGYEKSNCSDTGSYRHSKTGSYDIPDSIPLYKEQKPIPSSELPWKGVEIPAGREGQLAPMPSDEPTSPGPAPSVGTAGSQKSPKIGEPGKDSGGGGGSDGKGGTEGESEYAKRLGGEGKEGVLASDLSSVAFSPNSSGTPSKQGEEVTGTVLISWTKPGSDPVLRYIANVRMTFEGKAEDKITIKGREYEKWHLKAVSSEKFEIKGREDSFFLGTDKAVKLIIIRTE